MSNGFFSIARLISDIVVTAGNEIMKIYGSNFSVDTKSDNTPITMADRNAHHVIKDGLSTLDLPEFKNLPFLSEEGTIPEYEERSQWKAYWLVDPLDGTKEFVSRNGEFTVNVALIRDGKAEMGFVYLPVKGLLYFGERNSGAFRYTVNGTDFPADFGTDFVRNAVRLPDHKENEGSPVRIIASRTHRSENTEHFVESVQKKYGEVEVIPAGSSLKFCRIAEGAASLYPRYSPTNEWDTAAGHAVCVSAGGFVIDRETGAELMYNKESLKNGFFLSGRDTRFLQLL
jgi:3'(2'), 5'-bisphosphate nucleotidase